MAAAFSLTMQTMPEKHNRQHGAQKLWEYGWKGSTAVLITRLLLLMVLMVGAFVLAHGCSLFARSWPAIEDGK